MLLEESRIRRAISKLKQWLHLPLCSGRIICDRNVAGERVAAHVACAAGLGYAAATPIEEYQEPPYREVFLVSNDGRHERWVRFRGDPAKYPVGSYYRIWWHHR
jgi:hypothetical protein